MSAGFSDAGVVALTGFSCAGEAAPGAGFAACGAAASAEKKCGLSLTAASPNRTHEIAQMVRIDERRKQSSEERLIAMLKGGVLAG